MTYTLRDLKDTVVAITGATSGIGKATAEQLVELGAKVSLGARNAERLHALVEQLGPDNAVACPMDVRSVEDNQALINAAVEKSGKIGVSLEATRLEILNFWAFHLNRSLEDRPENGSKTQGFENGFVI